MLRPLRAFLQSAGTRLHSRLAARPRETASASTPQPTLFRHPYFVPRNTQGSLPVYSDVRNAGARYSLLIRNVQGDVNCLAKNLAQTLFQPHSDEAHRLRVKIKDARHLEVTGGRWKNDLITWLLQKGF